MTNVHRMWRRIRFRYDHTHDELNYIEHKISIRTCGMYIPMMFVICDHSHVRSRHDTIWYDKLQQSLAHARRHVSYHSVVLRSHVWLVTYNKHNWYTHSTLANRHLLSNIIEFTIRMAVSKSDTHSHSMHIRHVQHMTRVYLMAKCFF